MDTPPADHRDEAARGVNLGLRLRLARQRAGLSQRELARRLNVSPSFLSQIENGKARPSVATLYSMAQLLGVSIDRLFEDEGADPVTLPQAAGAPHAIPTVLQPAEELRERAGAEEAIVRRVDLGGLERVWDQAGNSTRLSVTDPGARTRLVMDSGVIWEQLASNTAHQIDFIEITYPPGASSTSDERMLRHEGFEYGYLLDGELEVTLGFDVFTLRPGQALGLNSSIPHLFRNRGSRPARGIWFVHHRHG